MFEFFKKDTSNPIIQDLLVPIPGDNPVGVNIRNGSEYDSIKQLRFQDDILPQGVWKYARKEAEWRKVEVICTEILKTKSKDSQVLVWLVEAWGHLYGAKGLLDALDLSNEFFKTYWKDMYPQIISEEDWESRQHLVRLLDDKFLDFLKRVVILNPTSDDCHKYTLAEYNYIINRENSGVKTSAHPEDDKFQYSKVIQSASKTDKKYLEQILKESTQIIEKCDSLNETLTKISDLPEIELYYSKEAANEITQIAGSAIKKLIEKAPKEKPIPEKEVPKVEPIDKNLFKGQKVTIKNTEEAFEIVQDVINYMAQNHPEAMSRYLLSKAYSMKTGSFESMLGEFAKYNFDVKQLRYFLGIRD